MNPTLHHHSTLAAIGMAVGGLLYASHHARGEDARLREIQFDAGAVVTVPVKRGVVTHVVLPGDESITEMGSGMGADCAKPEAVWCIAAQPGGRNIFVKPKSLAAAPNNLAVVTDRRTHSFRFVVLPEGDKRQPVYRLIVRAPAPRAVASLPPLSMPRPPKGPSTEEIVASRLQSAPQVINTEYSIAEGTGSEDILPSLVFDDGRFTYLRFAGNREVPAVFHVLGDGSEALVNTHMEGDLLVVDRVSRRLTLRAGEAVVSLWNESFDLEGRPPEGNTTAPGVERALRRSRSLGDSERQ